MSLRLASPSFIARRTTYTYRLATGGAQMLSKPYRTKRACFDALYREVEGFQDRTRRIADAPAPAGCSAEAARAARASFGAEADDWGSIKGMLASMGFRMGRDTLPRGQAGRFAAEVRRHSPGSVTKDLRHDARAWNGLPAHP